MKVLQFCQLYPPAVYGGGENLLFNYTKELVKRGHEVTVITQRLRGTGKKEIINGIRIIRVGRPIEYKGSLSLNALNNASYLLSAFFKGLRIAGKFDLIHSNTYVPSIAAQMVSKLARKPHVMTVHDVYLLGRKEFWHQWSKQSSVPKSAGLLGPVIERLVLNFKLKAVHTVSNTSRKDLVKAGVKSPVVVIPNAIELIKARPVKPKNQFCFVGRHVFYKNVDTVIKSMPLVLKKNPKVRFIIIGDGPMRKQWQDLAKSLGLSKNIVFTGRVSESKKLKIMNESKFTVLPSLVEGFGIVVLESWMLHRPVLVADVAPLNELASKSYCVKPYDVKAWTKKIIKNLKQTSSNEWKKINDYTIKKSVNQLEKLFKSVS